jgi:diguanylate cyclase (GGDEF)-like protein
VARTKRKSSSKDGELKTLIAELQAANAALKEENARLRSTQDELLQLRYDALTGLLTRQGYEVDIPEVGNRRSAGKPGCVAVIDVNNFKIANDELGHHQGDAVLNEISRIIKSNKRRDDSAIRWGGDEIVIIFRSADMVRVRRRLEQMRRAINDALIPFNSRLPHDLKCGVAIGCANFQEVADFEEAFQEADRLMYEDKVKQKSSL